MFKGPQGFVWGVDMSMGANVFSGITIFQKLFTIRVFNMKHAHINITIRIF